MQETGMIKRVAKAISNASGQPAAYWGDFKGQAHEAIKAMREPTEEMMMAYMRVWEDATPHDATQGWQAMIDEALK